VDGWRIGKPDAVFDIGQDYVLKGTSVDEYVYFTIPTNFKEGHWVEAVELQPGNRKVVHHAHVSVIEPDRPKKAAAARKNGRSFSAYLVRTSDGLRHMGPDAPVVNDACGYNGRISTVFTLPARALSPRTCLECRRYVSRRHGQMDTCGREAAVPDSLSS